MACILNIETSTQVCSIALADAGVVVFEKLSVEGPSHAALLGVYVEEAYAFAASKNIHIDAVAVSGGPGSYTGLRIGVSVAKGLCFGGDIPLIAIPTLKVLAVEGVKRGMDPDGIYCAMLDARRMEVYDAVYEADLKQLDKTTADIITPESFASYLEGDRKVYFFGNGAAKCKALITSPNAVFIDGVEAVAANMAQLSEKAYNEACFENTAYYEPFYLKEFVATTAKNKVLPDQK